MKLSTIALSVISVLLPVSLAYALPGPAPNFKAIAEYDYATGQIVVSYNSLNYWFIESWTDSLTGDTPAGIPTEGGIVTDSHTIIGESWLGPATATNLNLGFVAPPGLPLDDLKLGWGAIGDPFGYDPIIYINVPEPSTLLLTSLVALHFGSRRRRS